MAQSLFISDLHLAPERPGCSELFRRFLRRRASAAGALYILGDLFDAWIGDDDDSELATTVRTELRALSSAGTALYLQRGNRDFLLGRRFFRETGCRLLPDHAVVNVAGHRTLLMHGDLLCSDDVDYQRARRRLRNPVFQWLFLRKPLDQRRRIASDYRRRSGEAISLKAADIMDVNQHTVLATMQRYRAEHLIHGHTHRPGRHDIMLGDRRLQRHVLGEWHAEHGMLLAADANGFRVEEVR